MNQVPVGRHVVRGEGKEEIAPTPLRRSKREKVVSGGRGEGEKEESVSKCNFFYLFFNIQRVVEKVSKEVVTHFI